MILSPEVRYDAHGAGAVVSLAENLISDARQKKQKEMHASIKGRQQNFLRAPAPAHLSTGQMPYPLQNMLAVILLLLCLQCLSSAAKMMSKDEMRAKQSAAAERFAITSNSTTRGAVKNITFTNPRASGSVSAFQTVVLSADVNCFQSFMWMAPPSHWLTLISDPAGPAYFLSAMPPTRHDRC